SPRRPGWGGGCGAGLCPRFSGVGPAAVSRALDLSRYLFAKGDRAHCRPPVAGAVGVAAARLVLEFQASDLVAMDFVGAVGEAQQAGIGVGGGQAKVVAGAAAAKQL